LLHAEETSNVARVVREACSATWNLGTSSALDVGPRNITENLDGALKLELNTIQWVSSYVAGNTLRPFYKGKPVNAVQTNTRCLLWESY
jgi:hypothetical protein